MRVAVVTHDTLGVVLKVAEDWDTADEWVEQSRFSEDETNITGAAVLEA